MLGVSQVDVVDGEDGVAHVEAAAALGRLGRVDLRNQDGNAVFFTPLRFKNNQISETLTHQTIYNNSARPCVDQVCVRRVTPCIIQYLPAEGVTHSVIINPIHVGARVNRF